MKATKKCRSTGGEVGGIKGVVGMGKKPKLMNIQKKISERGSGDSENTSKEVRAHGGGVKHRLDRPGRKRGGRVGADTAPLSSAGKGDNPHGSDQFKRGGAVKKKDEKDDGDEDDERARGGKASNWIQGMHMKKGALHRELGVPAGEKIPEHKLSKAAHSDYPKLAKRAKLAETLKGLHP